jgi:hypothetical protein
VVVGRINGISACEFANDDPTVRKNSSKVGDSKDIEAEIADIERPAVSEPIVY